MSAYDGERVLSALGVGGKPNMRDVSTLKPIGSAHCPQYNTEAKFYIDAAHKLGKRHLVVHYDKGGHNGAPEFVAGIPDDWSEENVIDLILRPLEDANAQYPAWEWSRHRHGQGHSKCRRLSLILARYCRARLQRLRREHR